MHATGDEPIAESHRRSRDRLPALGDAGYIRHATTRGASKTRRVRERLQHIVAVVLPLHLVGAGATCCLRGPATRDLEQLYPLFHDDRELVSIHGCMGFAGRVGARLAQQLGSLASRSGEPYRVALPTIRRRAWSMLDRGAHDLAVPIAVRAACVEAMAGADVFAARSVVRECLASRDPLLLVAALSGMRGFPPLERAATVRALRDHPETEVRAEALMATERLALSDLGAACEHIVVCDPDAWPRRLAISYLERMPARSMVVVQAAARDPDRHVRESALRVLSAEDLNGSASFVCEDIARSDETRAIQSSMLDKMFATRTVAGTAGRALPGAARRRSGAASMDLRARRARLHR